MRDLSENSGCPRSYSTFEIMTSIAAEPFGVKADFGPVSPTPGYPGRAIQPLRETMGRRVIAVSEAIFQQPAKESFLRKKTSKAPGFQRARMRVNSQGRRLLSRAVRPAWAWPPPGVLSRRGPVAR